ncbi:WD40 repeat-like protein [Coprinopsis marcescibilis]|uniref:WD40 repeat-like protein n=1 Tax=Coprinopsis marcescibilis TaxID=230819 RepID=A0A5C3KAD3_COPMA|nr:WD40 repeat-like protein [Coprinopsis marcescibilis]
MNKEKERRPRRDSNQMDVTPSTPQQAKVKPKPTDSSGGTLIAESESKTIVAVKGRPRQQGPGDDITDPRSVLFLPGHKSELIETLQVFVLCSFNPVHFETLATGSKDAVLNLWKLPQPPYRGDAFITSALPPISIPLSSSNQADLTALHWSPDGNLLAVGSYDSVFRICTRKGSMYFTRAMHEGPIFAVRFSKNGRWVLTASLDGSVAVCDVQERRLHKRYQVHRDCCLDVDWLTDDAFASAGADMRINIINIHENQPIKHLEGHEDEINQIRSNPSGTKVATCSDDMTARIYRVDNISSAMDAIPGLSSSDNVVLLQGHKHSVSTVSWCPKTPTGNHEIVATASFDNTARLWDSVTGQCLHVIEDHKRPVYAIAFSPNGQFFATGGGDGWLHIFDMKNYERKWSWFAGADKPGVFEIDWQIQADGVNRIALALEGRQVAVIDVSKLAALDTIEYQYGLLGMQFTASANVTKPSSSM